MNGIKMKIFEKIRKWYHGEPEVYKSGELHKGVYTKKHWTARLAHRLVHFWLVNWKWLFGVLITLYLAYLKLG